MRKGTPREILQHINRPRDKRIADLEASIRRDAEALAKLATDERFTFFWRQLTNRLRDIGAILPGDGKGGLIMPKTTRLQPPNSSETQGIKQDGINLRTTPRKP